MSEQKMIPFKIKRQDSTASQAYWEEFEVPYKESLNVTSCLKYIQLHPVNKQGKKVVAVVYECNCLEEVCGACSMVINGQARQACSALIDQLSWPIVLEPLNHFPVIRDLMVDRSAMFDALTAIRAWVDIDGTYDKGPGPKMSPELAEIRYDLSRCMTCGCCAQSCPNYKANGHFIGPFALGQAHLFNLHPVGAQRKEERLVQLMQAGGIFGCGNSQNCERSCPKEIQLLQAIAKLKREVTWTAVKHIFTK